MKGILGGLLGSAAGSVLSPIFGILEGLSGSLHMALTVWSLKSQIEADTIAAKTREDSSDRILELRNLINDCRNRERSPDREESARATAELKEYMRRLDEAKDAHRLYDINFKNSLMKAEASAKKAAAGAKIVSAGAKVVEKFAGKDDEDTKENTGGRDGGYHDWMHEP